MGVRLLRERRCAPPRAGGVLAALACLGVLVSLLLPGARAAGRAPLAAEEIENVFAAAAVAAENLHIEAKNSKDIILLETFEDASRWAGHWVRKTDSVYSGKWRNVSIAAHTASSADDAFGDDVTGFATNDTDFATFSAEQALMQDGREARFRAVRPLSAPWTKPGYSMLVVQYELTLLEPLQCGGAYIKLMPADSDPQAVTPDSPYVILFGPDKCNAVQRVRLVIGHRHPRTQKIEYKQLVKPPMMRVDNMTHLYTLVIRLDNSFEIRVDNSVERHGSLLRDFDPPINPPKLIPDPDDRKPDDWPEDEWIPDPVATKPDDWDETEPERIPDPHAKPPRDWLEAEPMQIPDPDAKMPDDWDEEDDGPWEVPLIDNPRCAHRRCGPWTPPLVPNPKFKGPWTPPLIPNPKYKGPWRPREIQNPLFFEDRYPHKLEAIGALALEHWSVEGGAAFDNILIAQDERPAQWLANSAWHPKFSLQRRIERYDLERIREEKTSQWQQELLFRAAAVFSTLYERAPVAATFLVGAAIVLLLAPIAYFVAVPDSTDRDQRTPRTAKRESASASSAKLLVEKDVAAAVTRTGEASTVRHRGAPTSK